MKREFLQNFKIGDQALPKEVIDAIMDENGLDIESTKSKFGDYDDLKAQLAEAGKTIEGFKALDVDGIRAAADDWKQKYEQAQQDHTAKLAELEFNTIFSAAVTAAKGRSEKSIRGELGDRLETLRTSKNQETDLKAALEALKQEQGFLFDTQQAPPPYAAGTGTQNLDAGGYTKESFGKMGYQERLTLKREHPEIYESVKE